MRSTIGAGTAAGRGWRIVGRSDGRYCTVSRHSFTHLRRFPISIDTTFTGEPALALLIGLAALFRLAGAAARGSDAGMARPLGWLLCACAAWLASAAAGAFAPVGLALVLGLLFSLVDRHQRRWPAAVLGDIAVIAACGYVSIPPLAPSVMIVTAALVAVAGCLVDRAIAPRSRPLRVVLVMLPLLLWVGHGLAFAQARAEFMSQKWPQIRPALGPFFAIARADVGRPVELETGVVGWLTLPAGPPPYRPALLFHGADEDGSYQRGALFLRRALGSLGYAVLALDERGFGASPPPPDLYNIESWDPEPTSMAAARYLESLPGVRGGVLAVGHSMGATRALRFVDEWLRASAGVILGATVMPPPDDDERLYGRFIDDLDLEEAGLTPELVLEVRRRYFNNNLAATTLFEGHAPLLFVRFSFDYQNIIAGRNELFAMIPGRKVAWELRSDHQFASSRVQGVLTGDWRIMRQLQIGLARFLDGRSPRDAAPRRLTPRR